MSRIAVTLLWLLRGLPVVARRLPRGVGDVVNIEPPWHDFPIDDPVADARRMNASIDQRVREMPGRYNRMHQRFKTRPPGEASFYA